MQICNMQHCEWSVNAEEEREKLPVEIDILSQVAGWRKNFVAAVCVVSQ